MALLLSFLPDEAWLVAIQLAGLLIIIGARQTGVRILGAVLLTAALAPLFDSLEAVLPWWMPVALNIFFPIMVLSSLLLFFFGRGVWDEVVGHLVYDAIRAPFLFLGWLLRGFRHP